MNKLLLLLCISTFLSCTHASYKNPHIEISTNYGDIEVELYPDKAPKTVAAFLSYVDSGYFKNSSFYRVLKAEDQPSSSFKSELIQGGIWQTNNKLAAAIHGIPHESTKQTGLSHLDGTISLARTSLGTASTEFFICIGDQKEYDYGGKVNADGQGYAAFGKVVKGMDVVRQIHQQPDNETTFTPTIKISNIKRL
jgi:peptidyl-prolyl cis-trans isomerase A (cyclophilin A)